MTHEHCLDCQTMAPDHVAANSVAGACATPARARLSVQRAGAAADGAHLREQRQGRALSRVSKLAVEGDKGYLGGQHQELQRLDRCLDVRTAGRPVSLISTPLAGPVGAADRTMMPSRNTTHAVLAVGRRASAPSSASREELTLGAGVMSSPYLSLLYIAHTHSRTTS